MTNKATVVLGVIQIKNTFEAHSTTSHEASFRCKNSSIKGGKFILKKTLFKS